ncbi:MAG: alpha/beta fold hydrolase [Saprospiraceae bacterium]|nr:alpha/beta fold hydrolase [Saprospiraceae bacterium]
MSVTPLTRLLQLPHGQIEGQWVGHAHPDDVVIITNGHNGFYSYGMFPWIQQQLAGAGMSSFSYNFSHGGTRGDEDVFSDLDAYAQNCMRLERADLVVVASWVRVHNPASRIWLLAHSMGSIPTVFAAQDLIRSGCLVAGLILLAPVSRLDFWPVSLIDQWKVTGTITMYNRRTGQDLPHGPELLHEIGEAETYWNMKPVVAELDLPFLIVHGDNDEAVSPDHGRNLVSWSGTGRTSSRLVLIPGTGHTFGTKHPFEGPAEATWEMIREVIQFIQG